MGQRRMFLFVDVQRPRSPPCPRLFDAAAGRHWSAMEKLHLTFIGEFPVYSGYVGLWSHVLVVIATFGLYP